MSVDGACLASAQAIVKGLSVVGMQTWKGRGLVLESETF